MSNLAIFKHPFENRVFSLFLYGLKFLLLEILYLIIVIFLKKVNGIFEKKNSLKCQVVLIDGDKYSYRERVCLNKMTK